MRPVNFTKAVVNNNYTAAGYAFAPVPFVAGDDNIDACLVGTMKAADGVGSPFVGLAFRGTLPPTSPITVPELLDWFNDFNAAPVTPSSNIPGQVHGGFWSALMAFWTPVLAEIKKQMTAGGGKSLPLYIIGHSKGGAMASLAAAQCMWLEGITPSGVYTYNSVGTLRFINWNGKMVGDSFDLGWQRFLSLFELLGELNFDQIGNDHHAACGGGYMTYVCPTGVCDQPEIITDMPAKQQAEQAQRSEGRTAVERWRAARRQQIERGGGQAKT